MRAHREHQGELAAHAGGAAHPHLAAVRAGDRPHQGEAEARAPGAGELGTGPEPVEDLVQFRGEDPLTAVRDDHTSGVVIAVAHHLEPDLLALGGVPDRVLQ